MKNFRLIGSYFHGICFQSVLLVLIMSFSLLLAVNAVGRYENMYSSFDVIDSPRKNDMYYVYRIVGNSDNTSVIEGEMKRQMDFLKNKEGIEDVYTVWQVDGLFLTPLSERPLLPQPDLNGDGIETDEEFQEYNEQFIKYQEAASKQRANIILYDPEMLKDFPGLSDLGIQWKKGKEQGLLLSAFNRREYGNSAHITFYHETKEDAFFTYDIAGIIPGNSYRSLVFDPVRDETAIQTSFGFLKSTNACLLQYTEENLEKFRYTAAHPSLNFILKFSSEMSMEERKAVFKEIEKNGYYLPLSDIVENSREEMQNSIRENLPKPLFLLAVSIVAFFSTVTLTVRKKEKEMAIFYLCGGTKRKLCIISILAFSLISLIPTLVACLYAALIKNDLLQSTEQLYMGSITSSFIVGFFLLALSISVGEVLASMFRKSPMEFLRGAEK